MAEHEKLVIVATHGPEDPERATIPFVMACAALASDVAVVMGFQADGVRLVHQGEAETIQAPEFHHWPSCSTTSGSLAARCSSARHASRVAVSPSPSCPVPRSSPRRVSSQR
jgi:predicted peroxiredoxin